MPGERDAVSLLAASPTGLFQRHDHRPAGKLLGDAGDLGHKPRVAVRLNRFVREVPDSHAEAVGPHALVIVRPAGKPGQLLVLLCDKRVLGGEGCVTLRDGRAALRLG